LQVDVDHWYYAQFEPVMLEAAFYLLRHNETVLADPRATVQLLMKLIGYWDEATPPQGNPEGLLNGHWYALPVPPRAPLQSCPISSVLRGLGRVSSKPFQGSRDVREGRDVSEGPQTPQHAEPQTGGGGGSDPL
jgi:hypothetical protein